MLPTDSIGPYQLLRLAGSGASGSVFEAVHSGCGRRIALKLMHALAGDQAAAAARFAAEARVLRALAHPGIVNVFGAGIWQGRPWMAMQWVAGHDLTRYTHPQRLLPEPVVAEIGTALAGALAHAHAHGIVHRDLKPANVRAHLPAGQVLLTDFGLARQEDTTATPTGVLPGTPAYMAPEVACGAPPDARADLYSLGVVLFELLAGRTPFIATNMGAWLRQLANEEAPDVRELQPRVSQAMAQAVASLLQRAPAHRPSDAAALAAPLRAAWAGSAHARPRERPTAPRQA